MERARIGVSGGLQLATALAAQDGDLFADQEEMPVTTTASGAALLLSGDVTLRLSAVLGLSVGFSYATGTADADLTADTPHPFYFDAPRRITGTVADVGHDELALHVGLQHVLRVSPSVDLALTGGVSFVRVDQDMVDRVFYSDEYPYDSAVFESATLTSVTGSALGYHVAADLMWRMGPRWGIGILTRYVRASVPFELNGEDAGTARAGGAQVGAGVRWIIPARPRRPAAPAPPPRRPA